MDWTIYGALIAGFLALSGGLAVVVVRILEAWRSFKRLRRHAIKELDRLSELADAAAAKAATTGDVRLVASLDRLRGGIAQLAVLRGALDEVSATVARVAAVYPRK